LPVVLGAALAAALPAAPAVAGAAAPRVSAVPRLPHAVSVTDIEPFTDYVPQTSCDATPKPGVVAFRTLVLATYSRYGGSDLGISNSCAREGMTSEHSEGRAWDFGLDARKGIQRAAAQRFLDWLFAPDSAGNEQAVARRFGVMYVIWNDRIRSVGGDWRPYQPASCGATVKKRDRTACHENHVHLSFSWNGAWKRTSAWTGRVSPTDFGPCVPKGKKHAGRWTKANLTPCGEPPRGRRPPWPVTLPVNPPVTVPVTVDPGTGLDGVIGTDPGVDPGVDPVPDPATDPGPDPGSGPAAPDGTVVVWSPWGRSG
jgi:hypothetical protein